MVFYSLVSVFFFGTFYFRVIECLIYIQHKYKSDIFITRQKSSMQYINIKSSFRLNSLVIVHDKLHTF